MSNRTTQNNKRTDRKMESNDSHEIPDKGGHQKSPAFRPKEQKSLREDFKSIKYRWKDQKVRNETKEETDPLEVASYYKPWWLRSYSVPSYKYQICSPCSIHWLTPPSTNPPRGTHTQTHARMHTSMHAYSHTGMSHQDMGDHKVSWSSQKLKQFPFLDTNTHS